MNALTTTFVVVAIKLRVFLEVRSALVHIVTAVHSTSGTRTRPQDVDWALVHHESATMAPLPCETSAFRETVGLVVCLVAVVLWSRCSEQPTASWPKSARVYCLY